MQIEKVINNFGEYYFKKLKYFIKELTIEKWDDIIKELKG